MSKITAIIPVRGGSKRCINKNIRPFHNTNLLELRINILKKVKEIDIIKVNSDSDEMLEIAKKMGVDTYKRDNIYATDECSGNDLYECISKSCDTDIVILAYVVSPFIQEDDYSNAIKLFKNSNVDALYSMEHIKEFMYHNNKPLNFNSTKICRSQELPKYYNATHGIVIVKNDLIKIHKTIWFDNYINYEIDQLKSINIDTNYDFFISELIFKQNIKTIENIDNFMNHYERQPQENKYQIPDDIYLGAVYDALNIIVDNPQKYFLNIKPKGGYKKIIYGPALTLYGRKIYKTENYTEMDEHRFNFYDKKYFKNNPIIILQSNDNIISHTGDITSQIFKKLGAQGYITDGIARDIELIDELNFPIFCNDINPIDAISNEWAYTDINIPIKIGNLNIYPGDFIFASQDGVIIIPTEIFDKFLINLNQILLKERKIRKFVNEVPIDNISQEIRSFIQKNGRF